MTKILIFYIKINYLWRQLAAKVSLVAHNDTRRWTHLAILTGTLTTGSSLKRRNYKNVNF